MKFENVVIPVDQIWSSPFVRWQGSLADVSSIDVAVAVTRDAMASRRVDPEEIDGLVVGMTIPQPNCFYAAPWIASRLGMPGLGGAVIAQACATSVASVAAAAAQVELEGSGTKLVITTDRTSNGPLLVYPRDDGMGGAPTTEHWVLDSFRADPNTGLSMVHTAENVAREGKISRAELDELTLQRWHQYRDSLKDDRAFQRRYMQEIVIPRGKQKELRVEADEGVHAYSAEGLASLRPASPDGITTFGSQTHPADGCAGAVVTSRTQSMARDGEGIARLLSAGFARADKAQMPKAATRAAQVAMEEAGLSFDQLKCVVSHNPFTVNDIWFAQQTGYALANMNVFGCSLIYGHPQGPTGLRGIAELIHTLHKAGGGFGLFTGCAAGDTGAALVLRVD
jgi:acetyl-CoA acetyltransferase family protein